MATGNYEEQAQNRKRLQTGVPKSWLFQSILVTLFCCLPLGIVAMIYSTKVESLYYAGYVEEAEIASHEAGKWTKIGFWIGIVIIAAVVGLIIYTAANSIANATLPVVMQ